MGKNQSASNLPNIIQYNNGSINFVSGSTLLMQISSSGAITTTGVISGSNALSSSYAVSSSYSQNSELLDNLDSTAFVFTSSYNSDSSSVSTRTTNLESTASVLTTASASFAVVSASFASTSGSLSTRVTNIEGNYATTGSNIFMGAQTVCANITSTGTIVAQTLNVQQVTSSIVYSCGSNIFGCSTSDVQQFTGSVRITGSLNTIGNACVTSVCSPSIIGGTISGTTVYASTVACSPVGCFTTSCASAFVGGTISGTTAYASTVVCSPSVLSSGTICSTGNTCFGGMSIINSCLGIGTAAPVRKLDIVSSTSEQLRLAYDISGTVYSDFRNDSAGGLLVNTSGPYIINYIGGNLKMRIDASAICFTSTVCAPSLSIPGCIINTTDGGIFLKHCISDKNFWVWQENSCNWGQFSANCNSQVSALGGLFAGSGLATFFTNYNAGGGIGLSSLTGAGNACGVIGFDHNSGNAYFAGCVAIGTTCAMDTLTVGNNGGLILQRFSGATTYSSDLYFYGTRGTQASPTAKLNNDVAMGIRPRAYDGSSYLDVASIESKLEGVTATNVMFGNLIFSTNNGGTTLTERLRITPGGNVGIGTGAPEGRLHIQGCTSGYGANLVLLNFCNVVGASTGIDFGVDQSTAGCGDGNAQIKVCNIGGSGGSNCSDMIFSLWNGTAFCERLRIRDKGTILIDTGNNANQASTSSPVALRFNNDYSSGFTDASLKVYLFNSGATIQGFTAGPQYDLQYHSSGNADARHSLYTENAIRLMVKSDAICAFQPIYSACDYKAHTFCLFSATSIPCKTFTVSGNTTGCFSVTDFSGIPSRARAVLVYGWYNINGDGLAGQADHAVSWFGVQNSTSLQTWGDPSYPWPGSTSTFHNCNFGTFVMEHDGDSSATGMTNGMHYYGSWHQGIVGVDSGGCIKYNVAHGYSAGTHYNGLYAVGYWL